MFTTDRSRERLWPITVCLTTRKTVIKRLVGRALALTSPRFGLRQSDRGEQPIKVRVEVEAPGVPSSSSNPSHDCLEPEPTGAPPSN